MSLFGTQRSRRALRRACQAVVASVNPGLEMLESRQMLAVLAGHFPLDGDTSELMGNYYGAVNTGVETYMAGKVGAQAMSFNGSTSLSVTDWSGTSISSLLGGTASISVWIKTTQGGTDTFYQAPGITGAEDSAGGNDVFWGYLDAGGRINLRVGDAGPNEVESKAAINDGNWHHVAMTRDITVGSPTLGELKIYVDGMLNAKVTTPASEQNIKTTDFSEFGAIPATGGGKAFFKGALDDIKVYSSILTDAEVAAEFVNNNPALMVAPNAPTALTTQAIGARGVNLQWNEAALKNEAGYEIERAPASDPTNFQPAANGSATDAATNTALVKGLTPLSGYVFRVRAFNYWGTSAWAVSSPITTTGLAAANNGTGLLGVYYDNGGQQRPDGSPDPVQLFTGSIIARIDKNIDFNWGDFSPSPKIGNDTFTARWTGQIQAQYTENYNFYTLSDDGAFFYIKGVTIAGLTPDAQGWYKIIDDPTYHGANPWDEKSSTALVGAGVALTAGQKYEIKMEMFENGGGAAARLSWDSVSQAKEIIPQAQLFPPALGTAAPAAPSGATASATGPNSIHLSWTDNASDEIGYKIYRSTTGAGGPWVLAAQAAAGSSFDDLGVMPGRTYNYQISAFNFTGESAKVSAGSATTPGVTDPTAAQGLWGHYFNNNNWSGLPALEQVDAKVDFGWGDAAPAVGIQADNFSVIWTGQVIAPQTGNYTFVSNTDDHGELWVNGIRASYDPGGHGERDAWILNAVPMEAGKAYAVIFFQNDTGGGAGAHLKWEGPGITGRVAIDSQYLKPQSAAAIPVLNITQAAGRDRITSREVDFNWGLGGLYTEMERSTTADFSSDVVAVGMFPMTQTSVRDGGLAAGTTYYYRARSYMYGAVSGYGYKTITTLAAEPGPDAPSNLGLTRRLHNVIEVRWNDNSFNETGFRLERKAGAAGTWGTLATVGENATFYSDGGLTEGTEYFYRVVALNDLSGNSAPSNEASAIAASGNLPSPWLQEDIGLQETWTDGTYDTGYIDGTFEVKSNGGEYWWDPWFPVNRFNYVYRQFTGDADIIVHVADQPVSDWAMKAGPMFRESLTPGSKFAMVTAMQYNDLTHLWRDANVSDADLGSWSLNHDNTWWDGPNAPVWLKMTRRGDTFTSYWSDDGVSWTDPTGVHGGYRFSSTVVMPNTIYVGMAAQSHNPWETRIVKFDNVQLTIIPVVLPAAPTSVKAVAISGNRVAVTWVDNSDNETGFAIERGTSTAGPWTAAGTAPGNNRSFIDTGATSGVLTFYRVRAVNKGGESAWVGTSNGVTPIMGNIPAVSPWLSTDVGAPAIAGSNGQAGNAFDLTAGGEDIWTNWQDNQGGTRSDHYAADQFQYVYQQLSGDVMIQGQVLAQTRADGWSKAGFMIRDQYNAETLASNKGATFWMVAATPDNGLTVQGRWDQNNWAFDQTTYDGTTAPYYMRLIKSGGGTGDWQELKAYVSATGAPGTYRLLRTQWLPVGPDAYVGMAVTSHNTGATSTAIFTDVYAGAIDYTITPDAPINLATGQLGPNTVSLRWTDNAFSETGFVIERSLKGDFTDTQIVASVPANVTAFGDSNATDGLTFTYRVKAVNTTAPAGQQDSPYSNTATGTSGGTLVDKFSYPDFASTTGLQFNRDAVAVNNRLQLTPAQNDKYGSVFATSLVSIAKFQTSFNFQVTNGNGADGFTFTIQGVGPTALGWGGGDLGYGGIGYMAAAIKFDIYNNVDETGLYLHGWHPDGDDNSATGDDVDVRPGVDIDGGTEYVVKLSYDGATLHQTIAAASAPGTILFTHDYTIDLPAALGTSNAYVGFTGATGGLNAQQEITSWSWGASAGPVVLPGTSGDDIAYVKLDGDTINVYGTLDGTGPVIYSKKLAEITELTFLGGDGNDTIVFDLGNAFTLPVTVDGGAGNDTVKIIGSTTVGAINHEVEISGANMTLVAGTHNLGDNVAGMNLKINAGASAVLTKDVSVAGLVVDGVLNQKTFDVNVVGGDLAILESYVKGGQLMTDMTTVTTSLAVIPKAGSVLVKYTYFGDVNGDGVVNLNDYSVIDWGYLNKLPGYANGDVNYDGAINLNDYTLIDWAYLNQSGILSAPQAAAPVFSNTRVAKARKARKAARKVRKIRHARQA